MIEKVYFNRAAEDIKNRASTVQFNDTVNIPIVSKLRTENRVVVVCGDTRDIGAIEKIALLDEQGKLITQRKASILPAQEQLLGFTFEFIVRGN
ncbi:hypothetical protein [Bacillus sp. JJ722]|uniref:hypothetical protein n=1 Tax=Bacillus sp. JJ722 TaxID=3122973 RepID=UPI002FFF8EEA